MRLKLHLLSLPSNWDLFFDGCIANCLKPVQTFANATVDVLPNVHTTVTNNTELLLPYLLNVSEAAPNIAISETFESTCVTVILK